MKKILRHYVTDTFSLWVVSQITSGMYFDQGIYTLLISGIGITMVSLIAKPVINIMLLPINLVTYGLFRWVSSAVVIYLVTLIVPGFKVVNFIFGGLSSRWIDIPALNFNGLLAYIAFSFLLSVLTSFIYWLEK
ncbi:hypothetical protein A2955_01045 [Candidatus Woesebacteria bacterium RIFCSPLOWO2_01_FULL_37_19]|uniref:Phage holin family protein n=2 Tax=Candidatus Woeseibacteriota TaxID=1752722 RepID=A0A1F8AZ99_9BACT|nr:MAG: hypothetical protein A2771_00700 [Candidatus Woesebacteria bacterium RIFCSPHIGHO2_01_FULL_38_26b]OGM56548.1 MAG: hypothetical protein A2955_01045 [Candidatus Woesebacteria bacterium RIFCSPLOWO2_01_FULL_37_19]